MSGWDFKLIGSIETASTVFDAGVDRPLLVEIEAGFVRIRAKGMHEVYTVSWNQVYNIGALNAADEKRAARRARRKPSAKR